MNLKTSLDGNREVDEVGDGYKCMPAAGRYLCAKSADDIEAAAAIHQTPLAPAVQKLSPDDRGDIEFYADTRAPDVAKYAKEAEKLGKVTAIAGAIHLRGDSVSLRAHVIGSFDGPIAKALAGAPPPAFFSPSAAGATTVVRFHLEPAALVTEPEKMEPKTRTELVEQLGGDIEVTTSGHGLAGVYGVATLKDAGRVEAFVKKTCEETGGSKLKYALGKIAVTEHGCSAVFDPRMILLPVNMQPLPVAARVEGGRLVFTVGDATAPVANQRSLAGVAKDSDAEWALTDKEALVAFTRGPFVGPDLGAGKAFKNLASMVSDKQADQAEAFNDVMSHVAQAMMAVKVTEDGVILSAEAVTFDRDPEGPRKVYREALEARRKGDVAGYQQRLADIEKRFPTSLAAQRAAELRRDPPWLGAGLVALSSLGTPGKKK